MCNKANKSIQISIFPTIINPQRLQRLHTITSHDDEATSRQLQDAENNILIGCPSGDAMPQGL